MDWNERDNLRNEGRRDFRDNMILSIIGLQNGKYYDTSSEGYKALQELLEYIIDSHGDLFKPFKNN